MKSIAKFRLGQTDTDNGYMSEDFHIQIERISVAGYLDSFSLVINDRLELSASGIVWAHKVLPELEAAINELKRLTSGGR